MEQKHSFEMSNISIEFPGVKALKGVDFTIESGVIHALVGANGAGKSTLMKILGGVYDHYQGTITYNGEEVEIRNPRDSKQFGISVVHQEVDTALIPYLSVAENIMLEVMVNDSSNMHFVNWRKIYASAQALMKRVNLALDLNTLVEEVSLANKQKILVARALAADSRFLILDEPTAPLSQIETDDLFELMRDLAQNQNVGIVFISHRLPEIFEICDDITIIREGEVVIKQRSTDMTQKQVIEHILGRRFDAAYPKSKVDIGTVIFETKNLTEANGAIHDVSMHVRAGEIVGIAGLVGSGKTELCKTIFGALPIKSGELTLRGKQLKIRSPHSAVSQGLALVPEERRKEGILVEEPISVNITSSSLGNFCGLLDFINTLSERQITLKTIKELGIITPSEYQKAALLSGGNQQKVVVGKWLITDADLYIFDEPTKGVDIGAKHDIFELIGQLAQAGKGVIYASSELPELIGIADRIYVMYDQRIIKEINSENLSEENLLLYCAGGD